MSRRTSIVKAITEKFKEIDGTGNHKSNLFGNAFAFLKFWDETNDFPSVYTVAGTEMREYHPSDFTWAYLNLTVKVYCKGEDSQQRLEDLLEDVEKVVHDNRVLIYDTDNNYETADILVTSIITDEGLLAPYSIGEITLQVRYALM
ncbi:MAG: hypothetical protein ACKOXV_02310 [Bacteroidota bacterium]